MPQGHVFVVGDNRDQSADSRTWGFVPIENILGKASTIWLACEEKDPTLNAFCKLDTIKSSRLFRSVQTLSPHDLEQIKIRTAEGGGI